jgi:hypothetical protein
MMLIVGVMGDVNPGPPRPRKSPLQVVRRTMSYTASKAMKLRKPLVAATPAAALVPPDAEGETGVGATGKGAGTGTGAIGGGGTGTGTGAIGGSGTGTGAKAKAVSEVAAVNAITATRAEATRFFIISEDLTRKADCIA